MVQIILAKPDHPKKWLQEVAEIHIAELKQGSLIQLGSNGLILLYQEIIRVPKTGLWLAVENDKVLGFVAGCANTKKTYFQLLLRAGIKLVICFLKSAVKNHSLGKILKIAAYPFLREQWEIPPKIHRTVHAELLSIAVAKKAHRRGIGRMLVLNLESGFKNWGVENYYHVATDAGDPLSNSFYIGMGFQPFGRKSFTDFSLQIYEKSLHQ